MSARAEDEQTHADKNRESAHAQKENAKKEETTGTCMILSFVTVAQVESTRLDRCAIPGTDATGGCQVKRATESFPFFFPGTND